MIKHTVKRTRKFVSLPLWQEFRVDFEAAGTGGYQRLINPARVIKYKDEFDPDAFGTPCLSLRPNGHYYIVDGDHRIEALRALWPEDKNQKITCEVWEGLSRADEARMYVKRNHNLGQTRYQDFMANVSSGHAQCKDIMAVVQAAGMKISRAPGDKAIQSVSALERVYTGFEGQVSGNRVGKTWDGEAKPKLLAETLDIIARAWGGTTASMHGHIIEGIGWVLLHRRDTIHIPTLIEKLAAYPGNAANLVSAGRGRHGIMGGTMYANTGDVIVETYNAKRRKGAIEKLR